MPVNLNPPDPKSLLPVAGVRLGITQAGVRKAGRKEGTKARCNSPTSVSFGSRAAKIGRVAVSASARYNDIITI